MKALKTIFLLALFCPLTQAADLSFFALAKDAPAPSPMASVTTIPNLGAPLLVLSEIQDVIRHVSHDESILMTEDGKVAKRETIKRPSIILVLPEGFSEKFGKMTADHLGQNILIVSDGTILMAPIVHSPIYTDRLEITCRNKGEADSLYSRLKPMIKNK